MRGCCGTATCLFASMIVLSLLACAGTGEKPGEAYTPEIDPEEFIIRVDHEFFPLVPGTMFIYEEADSGGERVEEYVTADTRTVMGVSCTVVRCREYQGDDLVEETFDWYAQDEEGNVWYFGEDCHEYEEEGTVSTAGSWEAGVDGALPGIIMKGHPRVGDSYRQEYYLGQAEDMGEVLSLGETTTVRGREYEGVLIIRDWTPLEPGDEEQKYYAPGVGLILEEEGNKRIELVSVTRNDPRGK